MQILCSTCMYIDGISADIISVFVCVWRACTTCIYIHMCVYVHWLYIYIYIYIYILITHIEEELKKESKIGHTTIGRFVLIIVHTYMYVYMYVYACLHIHTGLYHRMTCPKTKCIYSNVYMSMYLHTQSHIPQNDKFLTTKVNKHSTHTCIHACTYSNKCQK